MRFSFSTPKEFIRGMKRIRESKMGTPSLARIIQDFDLALKPLVIVYLTNEAAVDGLADRNGHRRKVVGEGGNVSWGGARTKGKGCECELTKNMFLHSDLCKVCLKKNGISMSYSLTQLFFTIRKLTLRGNEIKTQRAINQSNCIIHTFDLR